MVSARLLRDGPEQNRAPLPGDRLGTFDVVSAGPFRYEAWSEDRRCHADLWWLDRAPAGILDWLRSLSRVRHRRLRKVVESGVTPNGSVWWAIPSARRPTLADTWTAARPREVESILVPFLGAARGLEALHCAGHALGCFDLDMMGPRGDLPIFLGAPPGMTDLRIDQYRLGWVLHRALFGRDSRPGEYPLLSHVEGAPDAVEGLEDLVQRLLDPRPALRKRSMRHIADTLSDLLALHRFSSWTPDR